MKPTLPTFGTLLKDYREERGLTQIQACKKIGISQTSLSQIEGDKKWPTRKHLKTILKVYKLRLCIQSTI